MSARTMVIMTLVVFLTAGALGWMVNDHDRVDTRKTEPLMAEGKLEERRLPRAATPAAAAGEKMARVRGAATADERLRESIALAHELPLDELQAWLENGWFNVREGAGLTVFTSIAKERWRIEDQEGFVAWALEHNKGGALEALKIWAATNPRKALAALGENPDSGLWLELLTAVAADDPALALERILAKPGEQRFGFDQHRQLFDVLAKSDPIAFEVALDEMPAPMRTSAEGALVALRLEADFGAEIARLAGEDDGWELFNSSFKHAMADRLLEHLGSLPEGWVAKLGDSAYRFVRRENAAKWLEADLAVAGFDDKAKASFRSYVLRALASADSNGMLARMGELGLSASERQTVISTAVSRAGADAASREELLSSLGEGEREMAGQLFKRAELNRQTMAPREWLEVLLDNQPSSPSNLFGRFGEARRSWSDQQRAELAAEYAELPKEMREKVVRSVFEKDLLFQDQLAGKDFVSAVMTDVSSGKVDDLDLQEVSSEVSRYAVKWMQREPEAAAAWVDTLPDGEPTSWVRKNLARNWADYDPAAVERWLGGLPAADREEVREFLGKQ